MCKNLEEVKAYDIVEKNLERYVNEMTRKLGLKISPVNSPRKAVENCDIVVTAGPILKHPQPVIERSWFEDGGLACPLDFDSYWKPEAMHSMDKFCTDDQDQLVYYKTQGYFSNIPNVYAVLSEIVSGKKPGREDSKERIMSMNLGLAIEDVAAASFIYERARKTGVGTSLPL
jgi:ornithine cyclodeaminase/alanine dehydrogenase-like protein (mu-crystallin family)